MTSPFHSLTRTVTLSRRGRRAGERGQLVIVGGEEGAAAVDLVEMLDRRPGDGEAVEGRRAAADLVEDDEGMRPPGLRIAAVSTISTMKVERPRARSSAAPTRLNRRSTMPMWADFAGTYEPIWASMAISAFWRRKVDLPAMLGPVTSQMRPASPARRPEIAVVGDERAALGARAPARPPGGGRPR